MTTNHSGLRRALIASMTALSATAIAGAAAAQTVDEDELVVTGRYETDQLSGPEYALPLVDTPQTVSVVPDQLLQEQGRRTLRDSLRNITGISLQAGEGNPPGGGDALSIRGFSGRDDLYVDGARDPGNYFRDPFNADRIEVTKGPASAFAGRGNIGGSVNIVSRTPNLTSRSHAEVSIGTDELYRATMDWNQPLNEENGIAFRLNVMTHTANEPGRDVVSNERWGFAPSIAFGLDGDTTLTLSYLRQEQNDIPDFGLPNARNFTLAGSGFEGEVAPVDPSNFYGYANDYRDVAIDIATANLSHEFSDNLALRSVLRWGHVHNDGIMSAPRFVGAVTTLNGATQVVGNRKPRDQVDEILTNQTDLTFAFETGAIRHTLVAGFEITEESSENRRRLDANGPNMNLFNPVLQTAPDIAYNGTRARLDTNTQSLFLFDTLEIGDHWRVVAGLRRDEVETRVRGFDDLGIAPGFVTDLSGDDAETTGNLALIYKPSENSSIYVAYGTAFEPSGRAEVVQLAGGNNAPPVTAANFDVDPELTTAWEAGVKWDARDGRLSLAAAIFQIDKTDARTPGVNVGDPPVVLDGEQRVQGLELSAVGEIAPGWNVFAGYTYLDGEVTESNTAFEVGQRLDNMPEHSASLWTSYAFTDRLLAGGGVQYVGERRSNIASSPTGNFTITAPSYTVVDAFVEFALTDRVDVRLNGYNLTDEVYFQSFSSGQSIPSAARSVVLSVGVSF